YQKQSHILDRSEYADLFRIQRIRQKPEHIDIADHYPDVGGDGGEQALLDDFTHWSQRNTKKAELGSNPLDVVSGLFHLCLNQCRLHDRMFSQLKLMQPFTGLRCMWMGLF